MKRLNLTLRAAILIIASVFGVQASSATNGSKNNENSSLLTFLKTDVAGDTVIIERQTMPINNLLLMSEPLEGVDISTYLKENLQYPSKALAEDFEGYVKVFFTVEENGKLSNVLALEGNSDLFADEVVKTLRKASVQPIIQNGQPARLNMVVPVHFRLDR